MMINEAVRTLIAALLWVGALFTGLLWKAALMLFAWYIRDMTRFTQIDGSIAAMFEVRIAGT